MKLLGLHAAVLSVAVFAGGESLALGISVKWAAGSGCSGQSPAMSLNGVPKGTATLILAMTDLDLPSYAHGGGSVAFTGKTSFAPGEVFGMFSSYRGPCPPPGVKHRYQWTIEAQDASGKSLGRASTTLPFAR